MILDREIQVAEDLARAAGDMVLKMIDHGVVDYKPDDEGPVTKGDYAADKIIREGLNAHFPEDLVITEETFSPGDVVPSQGHVWFIDPIDGTSDYVKGGDDYAVMIGLAIDGVPVLGIVFQPATGILWRGRDTRGVPALKPFALAERVEKNAEVVKLSVSDKTITSQGPVAVVSRSHPSQFVDFLTSELPIANVIKKGSVGLKLALIADGVADFYITAAKRIKLWDTCGPCAILSAAGGHTRSLDGQTLFFGNQITHGMAICATTPKCEAWLQTKLAHAIEKWRLHRYH